MSGKTVLVTDGSGETARATAAALAQVVARVGMIGQEPGRAESAAALLRRPSPDSEIDVLTADLSAQADVRSRAAAVPDAHTRLDAPVNSVG